MDALAAQPSASNDRRSQDSSAAVPVGVVELGHQVTQASSHDAESASGSTRLADVETRPAAWLCVFGAFLFLLPSYGFMQSIGTVQAHLQLNQLSDYTPRDIGWITGMYTFLALFLGIQTGPWMDAFGSRPLAPLAAACTIPMFFILAECTKYWHFMLCLGILGGTGGAITCTVAISVVGKLFVRWRGMAMGLALAGSSSGGIVFPLMLRSIIPRWGWQWSLRATGFVVSGVMIAGVLCFLPFPNLVGGQELRRVNTQGGTSQSQRRKKGAALNFRAFGVPSFSFVTGAMFLLEFAIFGVTGILPTLVAWSGFPPETGHVLIAILNGCSCLGRVLPGVVGDRIGHFNVLLIMVVITLVCMAVTLVPFGSTHIDALYAFSALWGFGSGSFLSLTPVCMGKTCEPKDYGRFFGTMNFVVSFALLITVPVGGQMLETMGSMALSGLYIAVVFMGGMAAFAARALLVGAWFDLRAKM